MLNISAISYGAYRYEPQRPVQIRIDFGRGEISCMGILLAPQIPAVIKSSMKPNEADETAARYDWAKVTDLRGNSYWQGTAKSEWKHQTLLDVTLHRRGIQID